MISLALDSTGWALVGALGGALVGSIVGAVTTALLGALLARQRTTGLAKAGARLLQGDFAIAGKQIEGAIKDGCWYGFLRWHDGNWTEYRGALVERLDGDEFDSVVQAARAVKEIFDGMPHMLAWPEDRGWMPLNDGHTLGAVTEEAITAYNILCQFTKEPKINAETFGGSEVGTLLQPSPFPIPPRRDERGQGERAERERRLVPDPSQPTGSLLGRRRVDRPARPGDPAEADPGRRRTRRPAAADRRRRPGCRRDRPHRQRREWRRWR